MRGVGRGKLVVRLSLIAIHGALSDAINSKSTCSGQGYRRRRREQGVWRPRRGQEADEEQRTLLMSGVEKKKRKR
jgi:hypothetical protein